MVLTSRFNRGIVLMVIAVSAGMFAQEQISRFSMAGDQPAALASAEDRSWQSAEVFYRGHSGVYRVECAALLAESSNVDVDEPVSTEPAVEEFAAQIDAAQIDVSPEPLASEEPVSIMAQSPYEHSWAATDGSETSSADESVAQEDFFFAMADQPPPITERRPASIPAFDQRELPELPAPAAPSPEMDQVDPELVLPPWQRMPRRGPADVESASERRTHPVPAPHTHSDVMRYIDPAELVRQRGIERGQQLQRRLEARRLLGYSPLRPPVQASPFTSSDAFRPVVVYLPRTVVVQQEPSASGR